jgi:hypothetical protein
VSAAATEHESLHAHAQRCALRFDTFPYEHARSFLAFHVAGFATDLVAS